jgi:hypothetical protein
MSDFVIRVLIGIVMIVFGMSYKLEAFLAVGLYMIVDGITFLWD